MTKFSFKNGQYKIHLSAESEGEAIQKLADIIRDTKIKTANIDNWILQN